MGKPAKELMSISRIVIFNHRRIQLASASSQLLHLQVESVNLQSEARCNGWVDAKESGAGARP